MLLKRSATLLVLLFAVGIAITGQLEAARRDGLVFRVGCDGFVSRGGEIILNRDNTGIGREQFVFVATDGNGKTIYGPVTESFLVGGRLTLPPGLFFGWTDVPTANPLYVKVYSPAGNNLNEQIIYSVFGSCENFDDAEGIPVTLHAPDGITSPSVPLNGVPPRPDNPGNVTTSRQVGYLIVNTDNLFVRSGDGPEYTVVAIVDGGTELFVIGRNQNRTWWYVQVGDVLGWVSGELTLIRGDLTSVPVVPVLGDIARPIMFVYSNQILASIPVEGALGVCEIAGHREYYIIGRTANNSWYELEAICDGVTVTGWLKAEMGGLRNVADSFIPVTD